MSRGRLFVAIRCRIRALAPLRIRPFGRLLASYCVNYLGDLVGIVALAILVHAETGDPLAITALFLAAQFLPALGAPWLTARVDVLSAGRVLAAIYLGEAAIFGLLAALADSFSLPVVLALVFADGVLMLTARGLTRGAVNATLEPAGALREGNGLINVGFAVSTAGGAALGGLLVEQFGVGTALALDAASFVVIAVLLGTARDLRSGTPEAGARVRLAERLREGLSHVRSTRTARALVGGEALAVICFTLIVPIEVVYAKETLRTDDAGFGLLLSAWGLGVVLGSFVFLGARRQGIARLVLGSSALIGLAYLGMALTGSLAIACGLSVIGGLGNGIQWVSVMTALQEATPAALQARVTGLLESLSSAATGVGFVLGGVLTALASPPTTFAVAGVGVLALVGAGLVAVPVARRA